MPYFVESTSCSSATIRQEWGGHVVGYSWNGPLPSPKVGLAFWTSAVNRSPALDGCASRDGFFIQGGAPPVM